MSDLKYELITPDMVLDTVTEVFNENIERFR